MDNPHQACPRNGQRTIGAALILAAGTNGLGILRGLNSRGIRCIVICTSRLDQSYLSRLPIEKHLLQRGKSNVNQLRELITRLENRIDCVIPSSDETVALLRHLEDEGDIRFSAVLPPGKLVEQLNDKLQEITLISETGIPYPPTTTDLSQWKSGELDLRLPVIVKPRTYLGYEVLGAKNAILNTQDDAESFLSRHAKNVSEFIAQEIIPGGEEELWVCNATFDRQSAPVSMFTFQRLGTIPYLFGVTTFAVSRNNVEVKSLCERLARQMHYVGPMMIEFKRDPRTGRYCYIEINPRLGMCNWFDTSCGVENAYNTYALACGIDPATTSMNQKEGLVYINLLLDVFARLSASRSIREIFSIYRRNLRIPAILPAFAWYDPVPAFAHIAQAINRRVRRSLSRA